MKKRNKRRRRNSQNFLTFARLEPKQLLAADLSGVNLITNGDFSTFSDTNTTAFFDQDDVTGWNALNDADGQKLALFTFNTPKGTTLKLDSTGDHSDNVFQDVDTTAGTNYLLTFEVKGQKPGDAATVIEDVDVFWDGVNVGTFTSNSFWQNFSIEVTGATTDLSRLEFREVETSSADENGNGLGVLIDNVCLFEVTELTVENNSFETSTGTGPLFTNENVAGWNAISNDATDPQLKLQGASESTVPDGSQFLNLDTTADHLDHVFNDIDTAANEVYYVVFDMRTDGSQATNADQLRVRWKTTGSDISSDQWVGTFQGTNQWESYGVYVESVGDTSRLEFREPGGQSGDGSGPLIDNVRIYKVADVANNLSVDVNGAADTAARGSANFVVGSNSQLITPDIDLSNASSSTLTSATAIITTSADRTDESLTVNLGASGLISMFNAGNGTLTISGNAPVATYQQVLRNLRYQNTSTSADRTARVVSVSITDSDITNGNTSSTAGFVDVTLADNALTLAAISDVTVEAGSPMWVPLQMNNLADGEIFFSASVADNSLIVPQFADGQSIRIAVDAPNVTTNGAATPLSGDLVFQLFQDLAPRPSQRVIDLANDGFYDDVEFHRIADFQDGTPFVIQGGDPTGTGTGGSTLGDFNDQFNVDLQHNQKGLLSFAKSIDDTNDSQFFITSQATRDLDFNHSIFGILTEGESLRQAITQVDTGANPNPGGASSDYPTGGITMTDVEVFQDNQNGAILLKAPEGVTGSTTVTVTATDAAGNKDTQTFTVNIEAPNAADSFTNSNPFLDDVANVDAFFDFQKTVQLTSQDVEGSDVVYLDLDRINSVNAQLPGGVNDPRFIRLPSGLGHASFDYSVDASTGLVTMNPGSQAESPDEVQIVVAVAPLGEATTAQNIDFQVVTVRLESAFEA